MTDARRNEKIIKKDQNATREIRQEIEDERGSDSTVKPRQENPNRDHARGDWDRSGTGSGGGPKPLSPEPDVDISER
jgi:hypothetical protein